MMKHYETLLTLVPTTLPVKPTLQYPNSKAAPAEGDQAKAWPLIWAVAKSDFQAAMERESVDGEQRRIVLNFLKATSQAVVHDPKLVPVAAMHELMKVVDEGLVKSASAWPKEKNSQSTTGGRCLGRKV